MLPDDKTFSTFDRTEKPLRLVCINRVLDILSMRHQLKIGQTVIRSVQVFMVDLQPLRNRPYKGLPHCAMNREFDVFSVFARAKTNILISRHMRFNRPSTAIAGPRFAMLDVKRSGNAGFKKISHSSQRGTICKHGFGSVNLLGAKKFSPRHATNLRVVADFVKAFIAANWFPNLHTIYIKPVYVGGQS